MSINQVTIQGGATSDVELRYLSNGTAVAQFSLAQTPRRYNKQTQQWEDGDTHYFDVTIWKHKAEAAANQITKGTQLIVTGRLEQQRWEDKQGNKRSRVQIVAEELAVLVKAQKQDGSAQAPQGGWGNSNQSQQQPQQQGWGSNSDEVPF